MNSPLWKEREPVSKKKREPVDPEHLKPEDRMKFEIAKELGWRTR